jgi:hypothetical protein
MTILHEKKRLRHLDLRNTVFRAMILAIASLISFWVTTHILVSVYSISRDDDLLGGMWAVVATIFVYRYSYAESVGAALSRMAATLCEFWTLFCLSTDPSVSCLGYGRADRDRSHRVGYGGPCG